MKRWMIVGALAMSVSGFAAMRAMAVDAPAEAKEAKGEEKEDVVKLEDCPKAVQDTITKEVGAGKVKEIEKEAKKGKTVYEVDATIDGKDYEIKIAEDGKLISKEEDNGKDDDEKEEKEAGEKEMK